jgi:hypothetical protein
MKDETAIFSSTRTTTSNTTSVKTRRLDKYGWEVIEIVNQGSGVRPDSHQCRYVVASAPKLGKKYRTHVEDGDKAKEAWMSIEQLAGYGLRPGDMITKKVIGAVKENQYSSIERMIKELSVFLESDENSDRKREELSKKLFS